MNRREAVVAMLAFGISPPVAQAQQAGRVYRLGTFSLATAPSTDANSPFLQGLRDLGWIEGRNLVVERRIAATPKDLPALAAELVRLNVDVIVVLSAGLASIAHESTKTIPIVTLSAGTLEGTGLVASLARPGGNVTGMQVTSPELMGKRIEILRELIPTLSRVTVLVPMGATGSVIPVEDYLRPIHDAGKALGVQVHRAPFRAISELDSAFATIKGNGSQAALLIANPLSYSGRKEILALAQASRLPIMYETRVWPASLGGLISYGAALSEVLRQAATFVDRLFRGAKASDLPVEQPTKYELIVNLGTAKAIGLKVPQSILLRADEVIQ